MARVHMICLLYPEYHEYMLLCAQRFESLPDPQEGNFSCIFLIIYCVHQGGKLTLPMSCGHIHYIKLQLITKVSNFSSHHSSPSVKVFFY